MLMTSFLYFGMMASTKTNPEAKITNRSKAIIRKEQSMNAVLKKKTEEWMQLERKTNEQRREADIFYQNNLMSLIEKDYQRRNKKKLFEKVDYLIMSVGTSYEPLVLNINLLQPGRILFLYTEKSELQRPGCQRRCQRSRCPPRNRPPTRSENARYCLLP